MLTVILSASIPAVSLIIVQIIVSMKQQRVQDVRFEMTIQDIKTELARLEKKQDAHNELIQRVAVLERDNKTAFNRIDELRDDIKALK